MQKYSNLLECPQLHKQIALMLILKKASQNQWFVLDILRVEKMLVKMILVGHLNVIIGIISLPETILVWKLIYMTIFFWNVFKNSKCFTQFKWNWWSLFQKISHMVLSVNWINKLTQLRNPTFNDRLICFYIYQRFFH